LLGKTAFDLDLEVTVLRLREPAEEIQSNFCGLYDRRLIDDAERPDGSSDGYELKFMPCRVAAEPCWKRERQNVLCTLRLVKSTRGFWRGLSSIYTHVLNRGGKGVRSPLDRL
jgi:hypothetical protein